MALSLRPRSTPTHNVHAQPPTLKAGPATADSRPVSRTLGLPLLLVALLVGGYLFTQQSKSVGPTSAAVTQAEAQASSAASATSFAAALPTLQAWFADHGSYAGVTLPPAYAVTVVRADATSYCLQSGAPPAVSHLSGPGGSPQPGPC
jgi:hypothetical protein